MDHPHIILLCPDELRADALGCHGNSAAQTPNLDRLAARAAHFRNAFVTHTKCTPSRSSLLTAQYPHVGGHRTLEMPVRVNEVNLVRTLREHGYRTALIGKNHCVDAQTLPLTFDFHGRGRGGDARLDPPDPPPMPVGSYYVGRHPDGLDRNGDHTSTTLAIDWLGEQVAQDPDRPLFLWLNWDAPHPPYRAPDPFFGLTPREAVPAPLPPPHAPRPPAHERMRDAYGVADMTADQWRELKACYLDMTAMIDHQVERMLSAIDQLGIAENTIVIFWSDHGDFAGDYGLPEKWDTCFPDCLVHVPLMIHAPGRVEPRSIDALIESIDILPTALDLAGAPIPAGVQGRSYRDVLAGRVDALRDVVFCQGGQEPALLARTVPANARPRPCQAYQMKQAALEADPSINIRAKMIRGQRYKLIHHLQGREELYDLAADPGELTNLIDHPDYGDIRRDLRLRLIDKLIEAEAVEPDQAYLEA